MYKITKLDELRLIKELRGLRKSLSEVAELTGNSKERVIDLTYRFGLPNSRWTKEEENFLLENYNKYSNKELAEKLNRSVTAVRTKRYNLNLKLKEAKI